MSAGRRAFAERVRRLARDAFRSGDGLGLRTADPWRLPVPDSPAALEAEKLCLAGPGPLANHSLRSYAWGTLVAESERRDYDVEAFYVAALLHDLGLLPAFDRGGCFEVDGATAASELLSTLRWDDARAEVVAEAIRLHMADAVVPAHGVEAYLLFVGTSVDVSGTRVEELDRTAIARVLERYPRHGFSDLFASLMEDQAQRKPGCPAADLVHGGLRDRLAASPLASFEAPVDQET